MFKTCVIYYCTKYMFAGFIYTPICLPFGFARPLSDLQLYQCLQGMELGLENTENIQMYVNEQSLVQQTRISLWIRMLGYKATTCAFYMEFMIFDIKTITYNKQVYSIMLQKSSQTDMAFKVIIIFQSAFVAAIIATNRCQPSETARGEVELDDNVQTSYLLCITTRG